MRSVTRRALVTLSLLALTSGCVTSDVPPPGAAGTAHPELWPAMSDAARAHVFTHFDASKLVEEQIALYREVLREG